MSKIKVPEGMLEAGVEEWKNGLNSYIPSRVVEHIIEAALRWLSENPIKPTHKQVQDIANSNVYYMEDIAKWISEWQRRMFLATEMEAQLPKEVFDILYARGTVDAPGLTCVSVEDAVKAAREAYIRGQKAGSE